jgi:hypothetical protein
MLLREEIEQSFGTGPDHRPVEELVARGRRRLLRRRAAEMVAAVAVVGVVGATYSAVAPGGGADRGSPPIAGDPSGGGVTPGDGQTTPDEAVGSSMDFGGSGGSIGLGNKAEQVTLTEDGKLVTGKDVEVLDQVDNPAHVDPPEYSVAVDVNIAGERQWIYLAVGPDFNVGAAQPVDETTTQTFRDWADEAAHADYGSKVDGTEVPSVEDPDAQGQTSEGFGSSFSESGNDSAPSSPDSKVAKK